MTSVIRAVGLGRRFGPVRALSGVDLEVVAGTVTGLFGRNGAGKTTFLQVVAGHLRPTEGHIEVFGGSPFERDEVLARLCLVRESQRFPATYRVHHVFRATAAIFPAWDQALADELVQRFELPHDRRVRDLSRGMRSSLGCIIGLASRAELTMLDEPTAGLDAVARHRFYEAVIAELSEHPRTLLLSTHLIDEIAPLVERAVVVHEGEVLTEGDADELRSSMLTVTGPSALVRSYAEGREVMHQEELGSTMRAVLTARHRPLDPAEATAIGLDVEHPSLQDVIVRTVGRADPSTRPALDRVSADTGGVRT